MPVNENRYNKGGREGGKEYLDLGVFSLDVAGVALEEEGSDGKEGVVDTVEPTEIVEALAFHLRGEEGREGGKDVVRNKIRMLDPLLAFPPSLPPSFVTSFFIPRSMSMNKARVSYSSGGSEKKPVSNTLCDCSQILR